jgi:ubiquinone/menaquinone biosynthesis C-methylase UbiE
MDACRAVADSPGIEKTNGTRDMRHRRQPESMKRLYNWFHRYYGLVEGSVGPKVDRIISTHIASIPGIGTKTAIEYACGSGMLTLKLAEIFRSVDGRDASIGMLERARSRAKTQNRTAHFSEGDILRISESAGSFDYAFVSFALHLFPPAEEKRILENLLRVARVAVMVIDHGREWNPLTAFVEWMEGSYYDRFIKLNFGEMAKEIGAGGFLESQEDGLSFFAFYK